MEFPLVVGVDGSESSLEALDWAADEAIRHEVPLRLVHAYVWEQYEGTMPVIGRTPSQDGSFAEHLITAAAERARLRQPELKLSSALLPEDTVAALLRESDEAFAIVVGNRGRGTLAALLLGSVSLQVAARARCPVIVVRGPQPNRQGNFHQVVLGVADTKESAAATEFAFREAGARESGLHAVRAWLRPANQLPDVPMPQNLAEDSLRRDARESLNSALKEPSRLHPAVRVVPEAFDGLARDGLLRASASADLVVVGAHHRHGSMGMQLGPVNHAVLHHASCPVAIVPPTP